MASHQSSLSLYRAILRAATPLPYNFRMYAKRRAGDAFRASNSITDAAAQGEARQYAVEQLALIRRQATMHAMFHTDPLVVESKLAGKQKHDNDLIRTRQVGWD